MTLLNDVLPEGNRAVGARRGEIPDWSSIVRTEVYRRDGATVASQYSDLLNVQLNNEDCVERKERDLRAL